MSNQILEAFSRYGMIAARDEGYHYASGGIGPYYVDLRKGCNNPEVFQLMLEKYTGLIGEKIGEQELLFVGVPTTGVIYATGLALNFKATLAVVEKNNPSKMHFFNYGDISDYLAAIRLDEELVESSAFLGLEDMGVLVATGLNVRYNRPSAILRRVQKGHGTSKTVEADLSRFKEEGVTNLYICNDPYHPLSEEDILCTLSSVPNFSELGFRVNVLNLSPPRELEKIELLKSSNCLRVIEVEDLWTTGTSSIDIYHQLVKNFAGTVEPEVLVFLDRQQGATDKFRKLGIKAASAFGITDLVAGLEESTYNKVMNYVNSFNHESFTTKLERLNESCVCVGLDITPGKLPSSSEDTNLPNYPYTRDAVGIKQYALDLLDEISKIGEIRVIKPNLAYYNSLTDSEMHSIMGDILTRAHELGLLVILDTKIGDIMRTQSQYAEKYKGFDAVTCHAYMGSDSVYPLTDAMTGVFVLVFTSNPSRVDLETQPILTMESLNKLEHGVSMDKIFREAPRVYDIMTQKVIDWQYAGSVGAVIGGTANEEGKLYELEKIVRKFANDLDYLPPILIPGVGTQGGSATDVINTILGVLSSLNWSEQKCRKELTKVVINSSSAINYSPRPREAAQALVDEIKTTIDSYFSGLSTNFIAKLDDS